MKCDICERTDLECNIRKVNGMYLCPKHLTQYYRYGYFLENTIYDENLYIIDGDICKIELRDKYCNVVDYAIIDIDDIQICKQYKWHIKYGGSTNYAIASNENKKIFLHRLITNCPDGYIVDHTNHNGLDNRKDNLVICQHSYNGANRQNLYTGITKTKSGKYAVSIMKDYKHNYVGTYETIEDAIEACRTKYEELFKNS